MFHPLTFVGLSAVYEAVSKGQITEVKLPETPTYRSTRPSNAEWVMAA